MGYDDIIVTVTDGYGWPMGQTTVGEFKTFKSVHKPEACRGQHCVLHNHSDHKLAQRPMVWRQDTKVMERTCMHGTGHPDPDHLSYVRSLTPDHECEPNSDYERTCGYPHLEWQGVHCCDGCC